MNSTLRTPPSTDRLPADRPKLRAYSGDSAHHDPATISAEGYSKPIARID